jgi:alcohol dehydrogenase class IV
MQAREFGCEFAIGMGGGSVLDTGKAVVAMLANPGKLLEYLEVVGEGKHLKKRALPFIAIPTTSGTGSEVTKNAVISVPEKQVKVSMRHNYLLPEVALVDPELTYGLPANVTAFSGMDALTQVIEPYLSKGRNWMVDLFCRDAIQKAGRYLIRSFQDGTDEEARLKMSWVSLMGGLSLANAQLGAVHGLAGPMGGMFNLPHGKICAALLHAVMDVNYRVILAENPNHPAIGRFKDVARWLKRDNSALPEDGINYLRELTEALNIPSLSEMGISGERIPELVQKSKKSSSMKGNPVALDEENILEIIEKSF